MALTYHNNSYYPWEIDPKELKNHYHVQLTPDRKLLVPGMLKQDVAPGIGGWLDVTAIDRDFSKRYFVQYTHFNTLVPGSLIEGKKLPEGQWKEIKRPRKQFHRITFSDPYNVAVPDTTGSPFQFSMIIVDMNVFLSTKVNPALKVVYPNEPVLPYLDTWLPGSVGMKFNLYYFKGNFAELANDKTKLVLFNTTQLSISGSEGPVSPNHITSWERKIADHLDLHSSTPNGAYSLILAILDDQNQEVDYVVLENILIKTFL